MCETPAPASNIRTKALLTQIFIRWTPVLVGINFLFFLYDHLRPASIYLFWICCVAFFCLISAAQLIFPLRVTARDGSIIRIYVNNKAVLPNGRAKDIKGCLEENGINYKAVSALNLILRIALFINIAIYGALR